MFNPTMLLSLWAVVGPLVGVAFGSWLATRNQRKHWLLDNKRSECRKLLTTLSDCGSTFLITYGHTPTLTAGNELRKVHEATRSSANIIYSRLFIADKIQELNIMDRWTKATAALMKSHDGDAFTKELDAMMHDVRRAALQEFS